MAKKSKEKYSHGRRICIFCGDNSGSGITKEHVFGLWLKQFFPRNQTTEHDAIRIEWPDESGSQAEIEKRFKQQGHVGSKKLRVLCRHCNNEVFSGLEDKVKKALPPLILGKRANLLPGGQTLIATWAAKTAMVAEYLKPVDSGIPQADRKWLLDCMRPPPSNWFVWAGAYNGTKWRDLSIYQSRMGISPTPVARPSDAPYYAQATTFGIGHVLFCVVSSSSPSIENFAGFEFDGLLQIWPRQNRSILWPPYKILTDANADNVSNIFKHSGIFDQSLDPGADWEFTL